MLADRPGSVQSSVRLALPAVGRTHPDHAALQLANLVFGGYFSSRWVENIREDKGYTYSPHSVVEHSIAGSAVILAADVATDGDRAGAAGDLVRAGPAGHHRRPARTSWSRPGSTPSARCCSACRPRPGWPGWPAPTPATGCGWTSWPSTRPGWPRPPGRTWPAAAASYLAPAQAATVVLGDADLVEPSTRSTLSTSDADGA